MNAPAGALLTGGPAGESRRDAGRAEAPGLKRSRPAVSVVSVERSGVRKTFGPTVALDRISLRTFEG